MLYEVITETACAAGVVARVDGHLVRRTRHLIDVDPGGDGVRRGRIDDRGLAELELIGHAGEALTVRKLPGGSACSYNFV